MVVRNFLGVLAQALDSYFENARFLSLYGIAFLVAVPLAFILPNFSAIGGIFLRLGSIRSDLSFFEALLIFAAVVLAVLIFSVALVAINMLIKSQRTFLKVTHYDSELLEQYSIRMFFVLLFVFLASLGANFLAYEYGVQSTVGAFLSFVFAAAILFAPQAIVIDNMSAKNAVFHSISLFRRRFGLVLGFFALSAFLIVANGFVWLHLEKSLGALAPIIAIALNATIIVPFLEVLKTQIYLSKYTIL